MICINCRNEVANEAAFCPYCGTNFENMNTKNDVQLHSQEKSQPVQYNFEQIDNNSKEILSKQLVKNNPTKLFFIKIINHIRKYTKQYGIGMIVLVGMCIAIMLFESLFVFEKFNWNKNYSDYKLQYVTQTNIKLGIDFSNEKELDKIKYETNCGEVKNNGLEIIWNLTESTGKCEITASYKMKKLKKEYNVIPFDVSNGELTLDYKIDLESDEDLDYDGLTNKQEKENKTNPVLSDSDMDGLNDYEEIFTYKTNPNEKDTDGDGLDDYDEIELGFNPLVADSKNDGIKDGDRTVTYNYASDKLKMTVKGKGNIASTVAQVNSNTKISNKKGLIDNLFTFYTDGTLIEATVTITYTEEELEKYELNEDNLSIYYYNVKESKYEKINTVVNKEDKTLTATLTHFSNYVVGDSSLVKETTINQVLFILDNSWSMYTNEQYKELTSEDYPTTLGGYDSEGIRFTLTSNLITKISNKGYQIGLSEFRMDYANALEIGSDEKDLTENLKNMYGNFITSIAGTNISNALTKGISEFDKNGDNKFIIILTDGRDTSLSIYTKEIIENAISKNVKICSIGFGEGSSNVALSNISNGTGCKFYSSSNVNGLTELFENVRAELEDNLIDIDEDNEVDGILLADSGFIVNRDGFSFSNYRTNLSSGGHCYGMATFAQLYYKKMLPLNVESKTAKNSKSYAYNLTNTYFKNYSNLYTYKLQTNVLKYSFGFDIFDEEQPSDLRSVENDTLIYNSKYKAEIENSNIYEYNVERSSLNSEAQMEKYGFTYSNYMNLLFNEDKMQTSSIFNNDDKQMFNAIYTGFIRQNVTTHYSSGTDFILWLRNVVGSETTNYKGGKGFINILKARLDDKDAPVITSSFSGGLHAINAISLVQDIENPNYYYIGVYDNNYPGEKRYVDIECNKKTCVTKSNSYYTSSGEPIRITPSLEYDLEYYNS